VRRALLLVLWLVACRDTPVAPSEPTPGATPGAVAVDADSSATDIAVIDTGPDAAPDVVAPVGPAASTPVPAPLLPRPDVKGRWPVCLAEQSGCGFDRPVWVESAQGFVNRWAVAKVDGKLRKEKDPAALYRALDKQAFVERVFADPQLELAEEGKLERGQSAPVFVLAARVFSASAGDVALKVSVNSHATIALNDKIVHDEDGDQFMLPDHLRDVVSLVAGWNVVVVRLEQTPPYAARLEMRLRGLDGRALTGVAWDLPADVQPAATLDVCAALAANIDSEISESGWDIHATLTAAGLLPYALVKAPTRMVLRRDEALLVQPELDVAALASAPLAAVAPLPADVGAGTLELRVGEQVCLSEPFAANADARRRILAAEAQIDKISRGDGTSVLGFGGLDGLRYQAEDLRRMLRDPKGQRAARRLGPALTALEGMLADVAAGRDPYSQPGVHVRAYRSELDGQLQRYLVVVPRAYTTGSDPAPLVMLAHGLEYTPEDMLRIALSKPAGPKEAWASGVTYAWDPPATPNGALLVADDGYGNAGQRAPGQHDMMRVLDEMEAAYRVDPRRVSISGFSLGGSVAFWVPLHYPSRFAGAAPLCGYPNILDYRSVKAAVKKPWEAQLLDDDGIAPYAESGRYLPLKMVHGSQDQPARSQLIEDRYKKLNYKVELDIPPLGHNVWDYAFEDGKLLKWLATVRQPKSPFEPSLRTGRYRWSEAYWLRIDRFADESLFGVMNGHFKGDRLEVNTRNVAAATLLGAYLGERATKPQTIVVDGKSLGEHIVRDALHLSKSDGVWQVVDEVDRPADGKRAGVEGPLSDVWWTPQIIVYGTQDPAQLEANRLTAERHAMHSPWITVRAPIKADVEVTDADLAGRSIVLIGNPTSNSLTKRFEGALAEGAIHFEPLALVFGGQRYEGAEVGISAIRPSPLDPNRYLVIHAGVGPEGTLSSRYLPELVPDYLVYDSRLRVVFGDRILGPRDVLAGGFYDARWRLAGGGK